MKKITEVGNVDERSLQRGLSNRHIQLIAIGGAIGTGLFMGSGKTIAVSGTSILFTYAIIGFFLFFVMRAMGEILLSNLQFKSFADFSRHYLGDWAGFAVGWTYWGTWVIGCTADFVVFGGYMQYWFPDVSIWYSAIGSLAILLLLNILSVKLFGELEFWFVMIKIVTIIALILTSIYLLSSAYVSPSGVQASIDHLFNPDSFMPHGIMGFFAGFQIAIFSFAGIELVGTTAAESKSPGKTLPKAINSVPLRVIFFYVLALACVISVSSWAGVHADKSPFVQLFVMAGFPMAAAALNFVVATSAMSAANSGVYSTARMLYGLGQEASAPRKFGTLSKRSVPLAATLFSCGCMLAVMISLIVLPNVMVIFTFVTTITATLFIFVWSMILVSYLAYRSKSPELHEQSKFKLPGGRVTTWACLIFFAFVLVLLTLEPDTLRALAVTPAWFLFLFFAYKRSKRAHEKNVMFREAAHAKCS
ncbi:amino acid permease [Pseudomonas kermanshahensis]|uniref:amino acid permease n=1 Tax=Pseudomonas kermanshahensis TaxID=2745482 RepID=UPI0023DA24D8|nr:amino acid permease [Pseudomonas kermanshahensis]WEL57538.1 amino acid permease [Pseudomonas kermanshahensis]